MTMWRSPAQKEAVLRLARERGMLPAGDGKIVPNLVMRAGRHGESAPDAPPCAQEPAVRVGVAHGSPDSQAAVSGNSGQKRTVCLTILGQIRGGKNNMIVTRSGKHIPKKAWKLWRDAAVRHVQAAILFRNFEPISVPCEVEFHYVAGDHRRRDMPAIVDAVWHVLERAGVVTDDTLLWVTKSSRAYDKANPRVELVITPLWQCGWATANATGTSPESPDAVPALSVRPG